MQQIANQLPDAFNDSSRVTKSHIPAENVPIKLDIPEKQSAVAITNDFLIRLKRERPFGSKDKNPRKKRGVDDKDIQADALNIISDKNNIDEKHEINAPEKPMTNAPEEPRSDSINHEISINFVTTIEC